MSELSSILLAIAVGVILLGRMAMPFCKRLDDRQKAVERAAASELARLKGKLKPGIYTFRWTGGQLLEPTADHSVEATRNREVVLRFVDGNRQERQICDMPLPIKQQLLEQIRSALGGKTQGEAS
ncbi:hypothetical protein DESUT3_17870 [Desulfuromonas versatilis]|uniref:Uncharacterized protein n=1 Tax=Desulfuromonas versatilis TaxID=2802975 RepID=A0ABN6DX56_9BACT|nr:hypothetical protein [Desulfuromonas versatilis]BCR04718.1 hypothetical protein DESUT3_17870 [Desulfuromonas versatilis]